MRKPTRWEDDPDCGHEVVWENQTHYCTYIRVPKLLTLQPSASDHLDEALVLLALQAYELWFKVLIADLEASVAALEAGGARIVELTKLLDRGSNVVRLLDRQTEAAESLLLNDLGAHLRLQGVGDRPWSPQVGELLDWNERLREALEGLEGAPGSYRRIGHGYLRRFQTWRRRYRGFLDRLIQPAEDAPTYAEAVALEALLSLQTGVKADWTPEGEAPQAIVPTDPLTPDELMFIVAHQAFELWFKAILGALDAALDALLSEEPDVLSAARQMRRVVRVQELLAEQIHIPATMFPMDFLKFRDETKVVDGVTYVRGLSPASGTESYQFREIEIVGGLKGSASYRDFLRGHPQLHIRFLTPSQEARLERSSLAEAFDRLLERRGIDDVLEIFAPADVPNPHADLARLADALVQFDERFYLWRVNHLTMVQTMIGRKSGTGFLGPEYLRETTGAGVQHEDDRVFPSSQARPRFFESLWEARTRMQSA